MLLVKLGGGDFDIDSVAEDLASLDRPFVLLHGANRLRDRLAEALGKPPRVVESISGYSSVLSDEDAIDVMMAAYAGIRNKRIVEALRRHGVDAIGLTGLDGGLVRGERNTGIRVERDGRKLLLRDQSGKPRSINGTLLRTLLDGGYTPVLTVPIAGADGTALNTENDEVLALLAAELGGTEIVSLIEEVGLLADRNDPSTVVGEVDAERLEEWEGRVDGRMRRKIRALRSLFDRADGTGPVVRLSDGRVPRPVTTALAGAGTVVRRRRDGGGVAAAARPPDEPGAPGPAGGEFEEVALPSGESAAAAPPSGDAGVRTPPSGDAGVGTSPSGDAEVATPASGESGSWLDRQRAHELDVYGKRGLTLVSGEGCRVIDVEGRTYIDCIAGNGSLALGHRHPALEEAVREQIGRIWCVPGAFVSPPRTRFLERLHEALPDELARTFLSNSGTEAMEAALKTARAHTGRSGFVAALRGFHGRTMGALSVTAERRYRDPFAPLPGPVRRIRYNEVDTLAEAVDESVAALVLEPVQGEGGVHPADPDFLRAARAACDRSGALLVFDEVQTGFGRTGRLFAFQHCGVVPDVLCLAKSIAGGLPLGATVVRRGIDLAPGTHGSTFGGNPIACAAARATLDVLLDTPLLERVEEIGARICAPLERERPRVVREIRRSGLMIGIETRLPARGYVEALHARGVLALTAGRTVLRLLPPLVMTGDDASRVGEALLDALTSAPDVA